MLAIEIKADGYLRLKLSVKVIWVDGDMDGDVHICIAHDDKGSCTV